MKIILLLNNDIYAIHALNLLSEELQKHEYKIFFSKQVGLKKNLPSRLADLKDFEQKNLPQISDAEFCDNINSAQYLEKITNFAPDLIISIRFGQILKKSIIEIPKLGVINLHSGILPNYRGVMATFWAMLNNEKQIGTTLHYITNEQIDRGPIIKIRRQQTDYKKSYFENVLSLYDAGCAGVVEVLSGNIINTIRTDENDAYYSYPTSSDIIKFEQTIKLYPKKTINGEEL